MREAILPALQQYVWCLAQRKQSGRNKEPIRKKEVVFAALTYDFRPSSMTPSVTTSLPTHTFLKHCDTA
jgi:hypothetical protein